MKAYINLISSIDRVKREIIVKSLHSILIEKDVYKVIIERKILKRLSDYLRIVKYVRHSIRYKEIIIF